MDKREKSHFKNLLASSSPEFEQALSRFLKEGENEKADDLLTLVEQQKGPNFLLNYRENEDETFLHTTAKYHEDDIMVKRLVKICPQLLTQARTESEDYKGQTAFHIAITKGNKDAVEAMLELAKQRKSNDVFTSMVYKEAEGTRFVNTVMMGGIPLSVAALTFNEDIVRILMQEADIEVANSDGDTVFHSLIKYAAIYPDKVDQVIDMLDFFHEELKSKGKTDKSLVDSDKLQYSFQYTYVWFIRNKENYTPLQLAAKHGVVDVFKYIVNLNEVYCFFSTHDGLFDIKMYDVTDVDSIANTRATAAKKGSLIRGHSRGSVLPKREGISKKSLKASEYNCISCGGEYPESESVLEMMFNYSYQSRDAYRLIDIQPVKNLVRTKWTFYRWIYYSWMVVHMLCIITLTAYAVVRPDIYYNTQGNSRQTREQLYPETYSFISMFKWVIFFIGVVYMAISVLLIVPKFRRPNAIQYFLHNLEFVVLLSAFSLCIVIDTFMTTSDEKHHSIPLIVALLTGWWFTIFFLRALKIFSFFTEMIKRVIIGDMLRFSVIMLFQLIAFSASLYILFQVENPNDINTTNANGTAASVIESDFTAYRLTMLIMFKLMLGLGDIETLYESRVPWLSVTLYVVFVMFTYVLLLNALIAMMSQTCALVLEDRYPQWRLQQLSVILFLEDIFCQCCLNRLIPCHGVEKEVRGFDPTTKHYKSNRRFFLEIHSLQMEYATEEDKSGLMKTASRAIGYFGVGTSYDAEATFSEDISLVDTRPFTLRRRDSLSRSIRKPSVLENKLLNSKKKKNLEVLKEEPEIDTYPETDKLHKRKMFRPQATQAGKSPEFTRKTTSKRKRHKSENLHEHKPPSPTMGQYGASTDVYASAPAVVSVPVVGFGREVDIQTVHHTHA